MKVLIVNKFYYNRGGDCVCSINLERMLRENGFDTAVFSMQYKDNIPTGYSDLFAKEVEFSGGLGNRLKAACRIFGGESVKKSFAKVLERFRPDVVHFNNIHSYISPVVVEMAKKYGAKTVWTLHDYKLICPSYSCLHNKSICEKCVGGSKFNVVKSRCMKGGLPGSILAYLEAGYWNRDRLQKSTDVFVCPSRFMAGMMIKDGFDPLKLKVICNSVPKSMVENLEIRKERKPYYLYVGRLSKEKGVETLLSAAKNLPYELKIAGGGPLFESLKSTYASDRIEFLGHLSPSEVKRYVAEAKFTVMPSECYDNNPLSVIESLCLGTPVVGAKIGGIPELVTPDCGYLFRSGDCDSLGRTIETAWETPFDYEGISGKAIGQFSENRYLGEILGLYKNN